VIGNPRILTDQVCKNDGSHAGFTGSGAPHEQDFGSHRDAGLAVFEEWI
jgi:hypothetical protein